MHLNPKGFPGSKGIQFTAACQSNNSKPIQLWMRDLLLQFSLKRAVWWKHNCCQSTQDSADLMLAKHNFAEANPALNRTSTEQISCIHVGQVTAKPLKPVKHILSLSLDFIPEVFKRHIKHKALQLCLVSPGSQQMCVTHLWAAPRCFTVSTISSYIRAQFGPRWCYLQRMTPLPTHVISEEHSLDREMNTLS